MMAGVAGISIELRHNKSGRWNGISINSNNVDAEILCGAVAKLVSSLNTDEAPQIDTTVPVTLDVRPPAAEKPSPNPAIEEPDPEPESNIETGLDDVDLEQDEGKDPSDAPAEDQAPRVAEESADGKPAEEHKREHDRAEKRVADLGGVRASPIWQSAEIARMGDAGLDAASIASALGCDLAFVEAELDPLAGSPSPDEIPVTLVKPKQEAPKKKTARRKTAKKENKAEPWSDSEIEELKRLKEAQKPDGGRYTNGEIGKRLGRSKSAVDTRMWILNKELEAGGKLPVKKEPVEYQGRAGDMCQLDCLGCGKHFNSIDPDQAYCASCRSAGQ